MDRDTLYMDAEELSAHDPDFRRIVLEETEPDEFPTNSRCLKVSDLHTILSRAIDRIRVLLLKAAATPRKATIPWVTEAGSQSINDPTRLVEAGAGVEVPQFTELELIEIGEGMLADLERSALVDLEGVLSAAEIAELESIAASGWARQGMLTTALEGGKAAGVAVLAVSIVDAALRLRRRTRVRLGVEICLAYAFFHLRNAGSDVRTWSEYKAYVCKAQEPRKNRLFKSRP